MKPSVCWLIVLAVLNVDASEGKEQGHVNNSLSLPKGYEFEIVLAQFNVLSSKLQGMQDKFQAVEAKLQSIDDNLHSVGEKLVKEENNNQAFRLNQEQRQKEMFAAIQNLERQVAHNLSEVHNLNQEKVYTVLQKLHRDIDNEHNIIRQMMSVLPQLRPITEIPQEQQRLTSPEKSVSTTTTPMSKQLPFASCKNVPSNVSGTYLIRENSASEPFKVHCEQEASGGGWIVFQFRFDGSVDFYRGWNEYRDGFGDLENEFWLGLEKVHQITRGRKHELIVEMKDFSGSYQYARYDAFEIGSESDQYILKELGKYSGTARDNMSDNRYAKFSTKDRDNDNAYRDCANYHEGAWWHSYCSYANLNGRFMDAYNVTSMYWQYFPSSFRGLSYSRMMIRELE